jgi:hypothetical protein
MVFGTSANETPALTAKQQIHVVNAQPIRDFRRSIVVSLSLIPNPV